MTISEKRSAEIVMINAARLVFLDIKVELQVRLSLLMIVLEVK